jgi:uncharacterized protein (TIGR03435 family)
MTIRTLPLIALCFTALAQTVPPKPEFDAASIKPSVARQPGQRIRVGCTGGPGTKDPGLFTCTNTRLSNLVTRAYSTDFYRVAGLEGLTDMFDITARIPEGTTKAQFALMLRNMLADRFHLTVHHEAREIVKYDLVVAKNGPKCKKAAELPPAGQEPAPAAPAANRRTIDPAGYPVVTPGRPGMSMTTNRARLYYPRMTMVRLADEVSAQMDSPVTDATGLEGEYEIGLYWTMETLSARKTDAPDPGDTEPSLPQALQEQLGLRLEQKKGPVDFLVVDHVDKTPAGN